MGLGAFAQLAEAVGESADAAKFRTTAERFAASWMEDSQESDGTRLAFNQPGSWSLKYNLVWDRILGLHLFPEAALRREQAFSRTKTTLYGIPLDGRSTLTKPEWMMWAACLADDRALVEDWSDRIVRYANETPSRVPLSDLYFVDSGRKAGFQARSVVGGLCVAALALALGGMTPDDETGSCNIRCTSSAWAHRTFGWAGSWTPHFISGPRISPIGRKRNSSSTYGSF